VGRLGGDEFAALALSPNRRCDQWIRQRLGRALKNANSKPGYPQVSLSLGIAWGCPEMPLSLDELIGQADRAMYAVKQPRRPQRAARADFPDAAAFAVQPTRPPPALPEHQHDGLCLIGRPNDRIRVLGAGAWTVSWMLKV